ncbi:MAG: serine hydroxymethyltransferase [bacterium]|nr:serine hydroxymethyltransferase [bacterium]
MYDNLKKNDLEIYRLIKKEERRQKEGLEMIPSENYTSAEVMEAMGSILTNKYSEGYPKKRYYGGNEFIDDIEILAQERAKKLFRVPHANVQPYSGSPANLAVYLATCNPGDMITGLDLTNGGHLTHGWKVSATAIFYKSVQYHVTPDGRIDFDDLWKIAKEHKPKLIWAGATAYVYNYDYAKFAEIAESIGAYLVADIAHVAGLIVAGVHTDPVPYAHIITTTTHKTLRGPRGGMIMVTEAGVKKDSELPEKIDRAIFPGLQGGPHDHQTAAIAAALKEASTPEFKAYGKQVVLNAKTLAETLMSEGLKLVGNGTENHLILLDLVPFGPGRGVFGQLALDAAGITVNKNTIPADPSSPFYPSGIRLGTPALTTRGMKEDEMKKIGVMIATIVKRFGTTALPDEKEKRSEVVKAFKASLENDSLIKETKEKVRALASKFPVPGIEE